MYHSSVHSLAKKLRAKNVFTKPTLGGFEDAADCNADDVERESLLRAELE